MQIALQKTIEEFKMWHSMSRKPGQPWDHAPVWYEPHPDGPAHGGSHGDGHVAITAGAKPAGPLGGARGTW